MNSYLPIEIHIALCLVTLAMLMGALSVARLNTWPWNTMSNDETRIQPLMAPFFVSLAAAEAVGIFAFLGGLFLLFTYPYSDAPIQTFGLTTETASSLYTGVASFAMMIILLFSIRTYGRHITNKTTKPLRIITAIYTGAFALFTVLLFLLSLQDFGNSMRAQSGYVDGAFLIFLGSLLAFLFTLPFKNWILQALTAKTFDQDSFSSGVVKRSAILVALSAPLMIAGLVMIAS